MREHGIRGAKRRGRAFVTTRPVANAARLPDLVQRDFAATAPDRARRVARSRSSSLYFFGAGIDRGPFLSARTERLTSEASVEPRLPQARPVTVSRTRARIHRASGVGEAFGGVFNVALQYRERSLQFGEVEVHSGDRLLDACDPFMLGLDDRADPLNVRGDRRDEREHVAYATVQ